MKQKKFYNEQHARTYLIGGIIRLGDQPIYIRELQGVEGRFQSKKYRMLYSKVGEDNNSIIFLPDSRINMIPVPLGMMETEDNTWYVQRQPSRGWKIGLNSDNIAYHLISGQKARINGRPNLQFNSKSLYNCIVGEYPSYKDALQTVTKGDKHSRAFSRQFAVNRGGLVFKSIDDTVGICERRGPILFDPFQYLKEALEKDMNR